MVDGTEYLMWMVEEQWLESLMSSGTYLIGSSALPLVLIGNPDFLSGGSQLSS